MSFKRWLAVIKNYSQHEETDKILPPLFILIQEAQISYKKTTGSPITTTLTSSFLF